MSRIHFSEVNRDGSLTNRRTCPQRGCPRTANTFGEIMGHARVVHRSSPVNELLVEEALLITDGPDTHRELSWEEVDKILAQPAPVEFAYLARKSAELRPVE